MKVEYFSLKSRIQSFAHACRGFATMVREEHNARIHIIAGIIAIGIGFWLGLSRLEWIAILGVIGLVFFAELINTAIENLSDAVSTEIHPKIKVAKDTAAAAVLIVSILSVLVGLLVFLPYFLN